MDIPPALVSPNVRRELREVLVGWTLREISDLFQDHGFVADRSHEPATSGERRTLVEQFYADIDWADRGHLARLLSVCEAVLDRVEVYEANEPYEVATPWSTRFVRLLARDGIDRDELGRLRPRWESLTATSIASLPSESAVPMLLRRMWASVDDDPDAAIGAAKEAIEATAKVVLLAGQEAIARDEDMASLIKRSQQVLGLHPAGIAPSVDGVDAIKGVLGGLSAVALGVNTLRRDYGTGHGRPTRTYGLSARHARLAAQAADAWVRFVLDTLEARTATERTG